MALNACGTIAVGHAPHPGRTDLRLSELLICDVRDLVRPARRNRRSLYSQKSADAFRVMPSDAKHRQLPLQPPGFSGLHSPQPDARADTLALLRPAALAQMARPQPFRGIAEFPDEPQDKAPDRKNGDLPRHKKQEDHPGRLMHDAAPCCR